MGQGGPRPTPNFFFYREITKVPSDLFFSSGPPCLSPSSVTRLQHTKLLFSLFQCYPYPHPHNPFSFSLSDFFQFKLKGNFLTIVDFFLILEFKGVCLLFFTTKISCCLLLFD